MFEYLAKHFINCQILKYKNDVSSNNYSIDVGCNSV